VAEGQRDLAAQVRRFLRQMRQPATEREEIAASLLQRARQARVR